MAKITYTNKVKIKDIPVAEVNKFTADNANEIKTIVNELDDIKDNIANKSQTVETDKLSVTKYPSVKALYDWAVGKFQLALGFTPANDANVIHTTGDEIKNGSLTVNDTGDGVGLQGNSTDGTGVYGSSQNGGGVFGISTSGSGVKGTSGSGLAGDFDTILGTKIASFKKNNVEKVFVSDDGTITATAASTSSQVVIKSQLDAKQDTLISGTNIKTINGTSLLGSGDITISGGGGGGDMVLADAQTVSGLKTFLNGAFGLRNVANTFTSFFANSNTASRTYTLQDKNYTLADNADLTAKANTALTVRKISTNTTLAESDNGTVILLTASCTVTLPNALSIGFNCSFVTSAGVTMTYALGGSIVLINNTATTMAEKLSHTITNTGVSNEYITVGL